MEVNISGKVALITGAGRGIGETLARRFGEEGARLALAERSPDSLAELTGSLQASGVDVLPVVCDVSRRDSVVGAVKTAVARFGRVDILVNNAGVAPEGVVERMTVEEWDDTFAVNTRGVFLCCQAVMPHMKTARSGRILNASSFAAVIPSIGFAAYSASKAAVVALTRVLAAELGPWGITANAYTPGMVPTPLNNFATAPPEKQERLLNTLSLRRWGSADDIASLLVFLASDHASYITGAAVEISGGKFAVQFPYLAHEQAR